MVAPNVELHRSTAVLRYALRITECSHRWSKLAEALVRRLLMVVFSMYFDDAIMQDWLDQAMDTQSCVGQFMKLLGSPWSKEKSQQCSVEGDFLGLVHDLSQVQLGTIPFWPRECKAM